MYLINNIAGSMFPNPDLLNCGVCHKSFQLQDIHSFILHKTTHCKKEDTKDSIQIPLGSSFSSDSNPSQDKETKKGKQNRKYS